MALQNSNGNYLRINKVDLNRKHVLCSIYRDIATRQEPTDFDQAVERTFDISTNIVAKASSFTSTGNLYDDVKAVGYASLKLEPPFNGADGETWTDC